MKRIILVIGIGVVGASLEARFPSATNRTSVIRENLCRKQRPAKRCPKSPRELTILLVNDLGLVDSFKTLRDALKGANHTVRSFVPSGDMSSFGSSFTGFQLLVVDDNVDPDTKIIESVDLVDVNNSIPGTPVECVEIGLQRLSQNPGSVDLIVSGFNDPTASAGSLTPFSGGFGAALVGTIQSQVFLPNVPSIAVSITGDPTQQRIDESAQFIVDLIKRLDECRDDEDRLLPPFTGLNINIPGRETGALDDIAIRGVGINRSGKRTTQTDGDEIKLIAERMDPNNLPDLFRVDYDAQSPEFSKDIPYSDDVDRLAGFVTIVPFQADFTAEAQRVEDICALLTEEILTIRHCEKDLCQNIPCLDKRYENGCCPGSVCPQKIDCSRLCDIINRCTH